MAEVLVSAAIKDFVLGVERGERRGPLFPGGCLPQHLASDCFSGADREEIREPFTMAEALNGPKPSGLRQLAHQNIDRYRPLLLPPPAPKKKQASNSNGNSNSKKQAHEGNSVQPFQAGMQG